MAHTGEDLHKAFWHAVHQFPDNLRHKQTRLMNVPSPEKPEPFEAQDYADKQRYETLALHLNALGEATLDGEKLHRAMQATLYKKPRWEKATDADKKFFELMAEYLNQHRKAGKL